MRSYEIASVVQRDKNVTPTVLNKILEEYLATFLKVALVCKEVRRNLFCFNVFDKFVCKAKQKPGVGQRPLNF